MSCPFQRIKSDKTAAKGQLKRALTTRQGSVQIPLEDEEEDKNTLNLKHLNSAILILTNPPNAAIHEAITTLLQKENDEPETTTYQCLNILPEQLSDCNHYAYLEDVYEIIRWNTEIDEDQFFDRLGQELINTCCTDRMERAFKCLGGNLKEFLTTLDGVHDVLKYQENINDDHPETEAAFICNALDDFTLHLDFTTERPAVAHLLLGSLKALAKKLYNTQTDISMERLKHDTRHFRYHIRRLASNIENGTLYRDYSKQSKPETINNLPIGIQTFCKAFPWHFVIDKKMELVQLGIGFMRLFGQQLKSIEGTTVSTYFEFRRPRSITLTFNEIVKRANTPFVLALKNRQSLDNTNNLELKGQMVHCPESDSILFIGSPFIDGLDGLTGSALFISDIPLHDATRDVILVGEQARAQSK
ncbi:head-specific guanylate cyclase-like [Anthonomus grandis grandis]|uniref:head-specific guanylate cyclase-like n=1 Tax=Anthonomus grandis grandis TaxID=2921223 RepID=UPI002165775A|nr:head-specific guanylate cyclase-like [Anthonomus grandis grandis]